MLRPAIAIPLLLAVVTARPVAATTLVVTSPQLFRWSALASAGDVDDDGFADVVLGSTLFDDPEFNEGGAFVFLGASGGIPDGDETSAAATLTSERSLSGFGASVAGAGDVNGDGYDDVMVAAPSYRAVPQLEGGFTWIFHGGPAGVEDGTPASAATGLSNDLVGWIGRSVHGVGDVNGDSYDDVASSGPRGVYLWYGGPGGIPHGGPASADAAILVNQPGSFTWNVAAGDVNGDGYGDVAAALPAYDAGEGVNEGAVFVFLGGPAGIGGGSVALADTRLESDDAGAAFGASLAIGDVDGDGYGDVVVGASGYPGGLAYAGGLVAVYRGGPSGISSGALGAAQATATGSYGVALTAPAVADVDGDGDDDVVLLSRHWSGHSVWLWRGAPGGLSSGALDVVATPFPDLDGSLALASAGDVDGDGSGDLLALRSGSDTVTVVYNPEPATGGIVAAAALAALASRRPRR